MPVGFVAFITDTVASILTTAGVEAGTAAAVAGTVASGVVTAGEGAVAGGALGAGEAALTGQNPLKGAERGAEFGAITGGVGGAGGSVLQGLGIGADAAQGLAGAAGGALGATATGSNPLEGAILGGVSGYGLSALSGGDSAAPTGSLPGFDNAGGVTPASGLSVGGALTSGAGGGSAFNAIPAIGASGATSDLTSVLPVSDIGSNFAAGGAQLAGAAQSPAAALGSITSGADGGGVPDATAGGGGGPSSYLKFGSTGTAAPSAPASDIGSLSFGSDSPTGLSNVGNAGGAAPSSLAKLGTAITSGSGIGPAALDVVQSNPGAVLSALGLGYSAIKGQQPVKGEAQLLQTANQLGQQGASLENYINTGTLPPGAQAAVSQAEQAAEATIKSQYAGLGLSGSTAESTAIGEAKQNAAGQVFNIANQLLSEGVSESNMSASLFQAIMAQGNANDAALQESIANFAAAAGGGVRLPKSTTILNTGAG